MSGQLVDEIRSRLERLSDEEQGRVLEFIRTLGAEVPDTLSGKGLVRFVGIIPPDDLARMAQAIEEDCEKVDVSEW
jgi:hypothetical protein